jgi:NADH dehydrogenase
MAQATDRLVTIYGGSGFLGRHLVRALAKRGWRIRVAVRRPELANFLQPLGMVGQIHAVQANVRFPESVASAAEDADALVNLTGILFQTGRQTFEGVQAEGARAIAEAAAKRGAKLVHVSAIGADAKSASVYQRTKAAGEAAARGAVPDAVIFRPSIVFGPEDDFFNKFAALARIAPALPLIGGGTTRFQPVFVDVAAALVMRSRKGQSRHPTAGRPRGEELQGADGAHASGNRRASGPIPFGARLRRSLILPKPPLTGSLERDAVVSAKPSAKAARCKVSAFRQPRSARCCRAISGASARPASSRARRAEAQRASSSPTRPSPPTTIRHNAKKARPFFAMKSSSIRTTTMAAQKAATKPTTISSPSSSERFARFLKRS